MVWRLLGALGLKRIAHQWGGVKRQEGALVWNAYAGRCVQVPSDNLEKTFSLLRRWFMNEGGNTHTLCLFTASHRRWTHTHTHTRVIITMVTSLTSPFSLRFFLFHHFLKTFHGLRSCTCVSKKLSNEWHTFTWGDDSCLRRCLEDVQSCQLRRNQAERLLCERHLGCRCTTTQPPGSHATCGAAVVGVIHSWTDVCGASEWTLDMQETDRATDYWYFWPVHRKWSQCRSEMNSFPLVAKRKVQFKTKELILLLQMFS